MNKNYKKVGIIFGSILCLLYLLFLLSPFVLSPILNSYTDKINGLIKESTGLNSKIEEIGVVTSPKLCIGIKIKNFELIVPSDIYPLVKAENFKIKLALLPLITGKIRLDSVSLNNADVNISVKKDGQFLFTDYIPDDVKKDESDTTVTVLPFGLKLSDKMPDISVKKYKISFIDAPLNQSYYIDGKDLKIRDFVFNKSVKVASNGKIVFGDRLVSNYDLKIKNFVMPNVHLNDMVFPENIEQAESESSELHSDMLIPFNIIDAFKLVNKNLLKFDLIADSTISGTIDNPSLAGKFSIDKFSVGVNGRSLPDSNFCMNFKGHKTDVHSLLYSGFDKNERTAVDGTIKTGKNPHVDLTFKSNAKFNNLIRLFDSVAQSFGVNDLKSISATGGIDSDFNIKSDMKTVVSNGYLKIKPSNIRYGLYNVDVNNIIADINFANNNIDISDAGFSVLGQQMKLSGTINSNTDTNLKLTADKLSIKGIIAAAGQNAILKDNIFNSGVLSLNAIVKGKFNNIKPDVSLSCINVNIFNRPSSTRVLLNNALVKILLDKSAYIGDVNINLLSFKNSSASVSIPKANIVMDKSDVNIKNSYLLLGNSRIDVTGVVKNYLNKMDININASGNLAGSDVLTFIPKEFRSMFPSKGSMPLKVTISGNDKAQSVIADLTANSSNYVSFADVNLLRGKTTKIHSDINILGDNLSLANTSLSADGNSVATVSGGISKLYSSPKLNLNISVPKDVSFPIWGMNKSNITVNGNVSVLGSIVNPKLKGKAYISDISIKDLDFVLSNLDANFDGTGIAGSANAEKFKFGGIVGTDVSGKFLLKDYSVFYLNDISGKAFGGNVAGKLAYNIPTTGLTLAMKGSGLNSTDAVYGAVGIKNALTGILGFDTNLAMRGVTEREIIQSMKGNIDFDVKDGRFVSIGKLENLVAAQNVTSYSILKTAISKLSFFSAVQESDKFKSVVGKLTLKNGVADISKIDVSGPLMAYHVSGNYNILPNTASLVVLGRLEAKVVSCLGVLGDLSAEKLLSYIPNIGAATAKYLNLLTANPAQENISLIPALSSGSSTYKDFKVVINGVVGAANSVKSFKWLSKCDTSKMNIKDDVQKAINSVKTDINKQINATKNDVESAKNVVNNAIQAHKRNYQVQRENVQKTINDVKNIKQDAKESVQNLKDLFKNAAKNSISPAHNSGTSAPASGVVPSGQTVNPSAGSASE